MGYWYERAMDEGREFGFVTVTVEELEELGRKVTGTAINQWLERRKSGSFEPHPSPAVTMMLFGFPLEVVEEYAVGDVES